VPLTAIMTTDGGTKVTDKMTHTDDSVEVKSIGATLRITPTNSFN